MTRRLLLAAGGGASTPPADPGDGGGVEFPATTDPTLLALRPTGMRNLAAVTATPGADMSTLIDTITDAQEAQFETPYGAFGPDHSGVLLLPPGEYVGGFGTGQWLAVVGTTGNPEDVVIHSDTIQADGVMHPFSPVYIEGVTLKGSWNPSLDQSPKYAAHIAGSQRTTFANVIFDVSEAHISSAVDSTWGCAGTVGMDGAPGISLTFYRCTFLDVTGEGRLGMNLHGGPAGDTPAVVAFIDCTIPKGIGYNGPGGPVDDKVYVIGGTVGGSFQVGGGVHVYTDHDNTVTGAAGTTRGVTTWPTPTSRGLSALWLDYYYPSSLATLGTTVVRASVADAAPMTPVAGRTYYCPVPVASAVHLNRWGLYVRSGAGKAWGWLPQPDPGIYFGSPFPRDEPEVSAFPINVTLTAGEMLNPYFYSWVLYPATSAGGNRAWFHFKIPDTTGVTIDGSAMLPGLHDCYYSDDNGVTLVKATAGTPFPLAHAAQAR